MEKTREYNNLSSDMPSTEQNLTGADQPANQNCVINNNGTGEIIQKNHFRKKRKRERKKRAASTPLQENNVRTDIDTNHSNKSSSLHLPNKEANNISILPKTADLSNNSAKENNTSSTKNLLKENKVLSRERRKKKEGKETVNSLEQDNQQTGINNLLDKVHALQLDKKDNNNVSSSRKTYFSRPAKHNGSDIHDTNTSTLESLSEEQQTSQAQSLQLNDSSKIADSSNANGVGNESTEDTNDEDVLAPQNAKLTFFDVDYEFHEANHAIIETFALNIYFSLCADNKKTYCLVCDTPFQVRNSYDLRKNICRHIQSNNHVTLLSQMIEDDKKCLQAGKLFSKLGLAREFMRSKDDIVECLLCDRKNVVNKIQTDDSSLQKHILSSTHQNFKVSWTSSVKSSLRDIHYHFRSMYKAKKYCCEFCNYESTSETCFMKHLRVPYHMSRLVQIPDYVERFKFHYCAACLLLWFGNSDMFNRHSEQEKHKHRVMYSSELDHLSEEIVQLLIMSNLKAETLLKQSNDVWFSNEIINYILRDLIADVQRYFPNARAYPFGSRISGLALFDSDIDIFLDCDNMYEGKNSSHNQCQALITLIVYYLSLNKTLWKVQDVILHSRTPIIKVQYVPSRFVCDISVTNGLAVENTKIIKCFNHVFPLSRKMILFLKQWLNSCGLLGSNFITSYALTWCVIFYLQTLHVLPSISQLIKIRNHSWKISGWEVGVSYSFPVRWINYNFEELLLGFFMFYAKFAYKNYVICPLLGYPIAKSAFSNLSNLPQDMAPYIAYMRDTCMQEKPRIFFISPLCVQDPFDLSHNLTKAIHNYKLNKFQSNCNYSAKVLKKTFPYLNPPSLSN